MARVPRNGKTLEVLEPRLREAGKGNQGDPIKLEILPDKFIGPGFGGQHPGANLG